MGQATLIPLAFANGNSRISMQASKRRQFDTAAQAAGFAALKPGPGNLKNEPESSLSNGRRADADGAVGRSPNSRLLQHYVMDGRPFRGSRASGKSNGWRQL
jgi:hypothetical protein